MRVIGISGLARSGKDTVADYIEAKYGFQKFVMSDVLQDELVRRGRNVSKRTMLELGNELRDDGGADVVARMIYERCRSCDKITVVGFRSPLEVEFFKRNADEFFLVEVRSPDGSRVKRAHGGEDVASRDSDDILKKGLKGVFSLANVVVDNDSTLDELHRRVDKLMKDSGYEGGLSDC